MKPITAFMLSIIASVLFSGTVAAQPAKPMNLLIITADDMNADSSGWMGNKLGATPNLDAFAGTATGSSIIMSPCRSASRDDRRS